MFQFNQEEAMNSWQEQCDCCLEFISQNSMEGLSDMLYKLRHNEGIDLQEAVVELTGSFAYMDTGNDGEVHSASRDMKVIMYGQSVAVPVSLYRLLKNLASCVADESLYFCKINYGWGVALYRILRDDPVPKAFSLLNNGGKPVSISVAPVKTVEFLTNVYSAFLSSDWEKELRSRF